MLIEHIRDYMRGAERTINAEAMTWAVDRFKESFLRQINHEKKERPQGSLYASDATKCPRRTMYAALSVEGEPMGQDVRFKLLAGDLIELSLVYISQLLKGVRVVSNNLKMDFTVGGKPRRGATDGILVSPLGERIHVEFKSASDVGFRMTMKKGVDDNFGYLGQAEVYHRELKKVGMVNSDKTLFIYINRDTMKLAEIEHVYTGEYAAMADANFVAIDDAIARKKLVPRPYALEGRRLPLQCSYCPYKWTCWTEPGQVVTFGEGDKPRYREQPTQTLAMEFSKNGKPIWSLV